MKRWMEQQHAAHCRPAQLHVPLSQRHPTLCSCLVCARACSSLRWVLRKERIVSATSSSGMLSCGCGQGGGRVGAKGGEQSAPGIPPGEGEVQDKQWSLPAALQCPPAQRTTAHAELLLRNRSTAAGLLAWLTWLRTAAASCSEGSKISGTTAVAPALSSMMPATGRGEFDVAHSRPQAPAPVWNHPEWLRVRRPAETRLVQPQAGTHPWRPTPPWVRLSQGCPALPHPAHHSRCRTRAQRS